MRLSPRETQIAALITHGGLSNKQIAKRLGVTEKTVGWHVENLGKKLPGFGKPRHRITVFFLKIEDHEREPEPNP